jgi:hypothetical protein
MAVFQSQVLPDATGPQINPNILFSLQQAAIARALALGECLGSTVLDYTSSFDYKDSRKRECLSNVVGNAQQRSFPPVPASTGKQNASLLTIQATKRLVKNGQPHTGLVHSAPQPHSLSFTTRHQRTTFTQFGLQALRQLLEQFVQRSFLEKVLCRQCIHGRSVAEVVKQSAVPNLYRRIDPSGLGSQPFNSRSLEWTAVYQHSARCRSVPAQ